MIFVFGSNELGQHGGGAAFIAKRDHGARYEGKGGAGQGFGPQGNSFAIPTCATTTNKPGFEIPAERLAYYVACFIAYAKHYPNETFQVTRIGCGLAGWKDEQVAPLFANAPDNCQFDTAWKPWLGENRKYWGHVD